MPTRPETPDPSGGPTLDRRFLAGTRGRVVALLRSGPRTVDELAAAIELTHNAVRAQLAVLERDGLVRQGGARKGVRRPAVEYELTTEAEVFLSRAYVPLFEALIGVLADWLARPDLEELFREAGRCAAHARPAPAGDPGERVRAASRVLDELGGLTTVDTGPAGWVIRSEGCPVGALVQRRPEVCAAIEAMVAELTRLPVREGCDRSGERPRCRFAVGAPAPERGEPPRH